MADDESSASDSAPLQQSRIRDLFDGSDLQGGSEADGTTAAPTRAGRLKITPITRRLISAGADICQDAPEEFTFQHTVLCQTALPAKRPPDHIRTWQRQQGRAVLLVEAGKAWHPEREEFVPLGLPFGPKARLILMHLNAEAIRNQSPIISVEESLTRFVARILGAQYRRPHRTGRNLVRSPSGPEIRAFKEQLSCLAAANLTMAITRDEMPVQINTHIVGAFNLWFPKNERQRVMWPSTVRLSLDYYESLARHAVPLDERAIAALAHSAMALDIYAWLAQRLHRIAATRPQFVPWSALWEQFGQGYAQIRQFRAFFIRQLREVQTVYPAARFDTGPKGMNLWFSPPPVAKRLIALTGSDRPKP